MAPSLEGSLIDRAGGIGGDDVAAFLQLQRPLQAVDLDFAADALGALSPLQLDGLQAVLLDDIFGNAQPGVFHVHLDQDFAVALMIAAVDLDAAVHVRRLGDLAFGVQLQLGIDAADVLAADQGDAADGSAHGKMLPVLAGNFGGTQGAGEDRGPSS